MSHHLGGLTAQEGSAARGGVDAEANGSQTSTKTRPSLAGSTLLSMKRKDANSIMGHISYEVCPPH